MTVTPTSTDNTAMIRVIDVPVISGAIYVFDTGAPVVQ